MASSSDPTSRSQRLSVFLDFAKKSLQSDREIEVEACYPLTPDDVCVKIAQAIGEIVVNQNGGRIKFVPDTPSDWEQTAKLRALVGSEGMNAIKLLKAARKRSQSSEVKKVSMDQDRKKLKLTAESLSLAVEPSLERDTAGVAPTTPSSAKVALDIFESFARVHPDTGIVDVSGLFSEECMEKIYETVSPQDSVRRGRQGTERKRLVVHQILRSVIENAEGVSFSAVVEKELLLRLRAMKERPPTLGYHEKVQAFTFLDDFTTREAKTAISFLASSRGIVHFFPLVDEQHVEVYLRILGEYGRTHPSRREMMKEVVSKIRSGSLISAFEPKTAALALLPNCLASLVPGATSFAHHMQKHMGPLVTVETSFAPTQGERKQVKVLVSQTIPRNGSEAV